MRKIALTITFIFITAFCFAGSEVTNTVTSSGISLGSAIAAITSWDRNKSILWAIIHGILGWFYVIYFAITRK